MLLRGLHTLLSCISRSLGGTACGCGCLQLVAVRAGSLLLLSGLRRCCLQLKLAHLNFCAQRIPALTAIALFRRRAGLLAAGVIGLLAHGFKLLFQGGALRAAFALGGAQCFKALLRRCALRCQRLQRSFCSLQCAGLRRQGCIQPDQLGL